MGVAPGGAAAFRSGVMAAAVTFMLLAPGCLGEPMRTGEPAAAAPTVGDAGARATPGSAPTQAVDAPAREGAEAHPGGVPGEKGLLSLEDRKPCLGPLQEVPLQGLSCPVGGGWRIFLENGASFFTHGPDSNVADGTAEAGSSATTDLPEPFSEPVCGDGPGAKAGHVLVAVPSDLELTPHRLAEYRNAVLQANAFLRAEAAAFGVETNLRVVCDAAGSLLLHVVNLPELDKDYTSFTKVISEVARQGFHSFGDKYWIFYHGRARGVGGQATLDEDDSPGPGNRNNFGPSYAIVWGSASAHVFLHEVSHNLGAVQNSAPHSSGSHHCIDGLDTMCYPDSGPRAVAYTELSCNRRRYDCGNDDYFNPKPEPGTYLATHWNLGGPNNLWFDRCAPAEAAAARDLALCRIHAPRWRLGGETVTLSLALYNFGLFTEQGARLQVRVDGAPLTEVAVPDLPPGGPHVIRVPWATPEGGAVHVVTASLLAAESPTLPREENTANNEARTKAARLAGTEGSAVPRSLRAVSVDHAKREATLTWAPPEKDPTHAWRYQVYLRTGSATAAPAPLGEPVNHTAFTFTAPAPGLYFLQVTALRATGEESAPTPLLSLHLPAPASAPRSLSAAPVPEPGVLEVRWTAPERTDGQSVTEYLLEHQAGSAAAPTQVRVTPSGASRFLLRGLPGGEPVAVRVAAVTTPGLGAWSAPVSATPYAAKAPPVPLLMAESGPRSREITLTWTLPEEAPRGPPATRFLVYRQAAGSEPALVANLTSGATHVDRDLLYDLDYTYTVVAANGYGASAPSAPAVAQSLRSWAARSGTAAVSTPSGVFLFGGLEADLDAPVNHILRYDPVKGTFLAREARLPVAAYGMAAVWDARDRPASGCPGGCIFLFGGLAANGTVLDTVLQYAPATDALYLLTARIPTPREGMVAVTAGETVLLFGGAPEAATVLRFDPLKETLVPVPRTEGLLATAPLTTLPVGGMAVLWSGREAFLFGGLDERGVPLDGILRYDPATGAFAQAGRLPSARAHQAAVLVSGHAYVLGGEGLTGSCIDLTCTLQDVVRYTLATGAVSTAAGTLPSPRERLGAVALGQDIHLFGGCEDPRCESVAAKVERLRVFP